MNKSIISWSGGKDSCLAMDKAKKLGYIPVCLLTTMPKEVERSFGHGLSAEILKKQAEALCLPINFVMFNDGEYEQAFIEALKELKEKYGAEHVVFGDIYLEEHKAWGVNVCEKAGLKAIYPLWTDEINRYTALENFLESGYRAIITNIAIDTLSIAYLGQSVNDIFAKYIKHTRFCPVGEHGEYHTIVVDGPLFHKSLDIILSGAQENKHGYSLIVRSAMK